MPKIDVGDRVKWSSLGIKDCNPRYPLAEGTILKIIPPHHLAVEWDQSGYTILNKVYIDAPNNPNKSPS